MLFSDKICPRQDNWSITHLFHHLLCRFDAVWSLLPLPSARSIDKFSPPLNILHYILESIPGLFVSKMAAHLRKTCHFYEMDKVLDLWEGITHAHKYCAKGPGFYFLFLVLFLRNSVNRHRHAGWGSTPLWLDRKNTLNPLITIRRRKQQRTEWRTIYIRETTLQHYYTLCVCRTVFVFSLKHSGWGGGVASFKF